MDTLTHALSGALLARAVAHPKSRLGLGNRTLAGALAAAFPDLDYALFLVAPLNFLNWHRGPTHSLVLLPLWAWLLASILARLWSGRQHWLDFYGVCVLGLAAHIAGDIITIYGTQVLSPFSDEPFALGIVFDIDPYLAVIVAVGFLFSLRLRVVPVALLTLAAVIGYLGLQAAMHSQAIALGKAYGAKQRFKDFQVYAFPRPFSPFTWQVVIAHDDDYRVAQLMNDLFPSQVINPQETRFPWSIITAYRHPSDLHWNRYFRFGDTQETKALAREVWNQDRFAAFRRFSTLPALYRIDHKTKGEVCIWFTDLRHLFPTMPPPFRYGMCRTGPQGDWRLYRLGYFTDNNRQLL